MPDNRIVFQPGKEYDQEEQKKFLSELNQKLPTTYQWVKVRVSVYRDASPMLAWIADGSAVVRGIWVFSPVEVGPSQEDFAIFDVYHAQRRESFLPAGSWSTTDGLPAATKVLLSHTMEIPGKELSHAPNMRLDFLEEIHIRWKFNNADTSDSPPIPIPSDGLGSDGAPVYALSQQEEMDVVDSQAAGPPVSDLDFFIMVERV